MDEITTARRNALAQAIDRAGSQSELARRLNRRLQRRKPIRQSHVSNWLHRDEQVTPAEVCRAIEAETGVSAADLREDVFGAMEQTAA